MVRIQVRDSNGSSESADINLLPLATLLERMRDFAPPTNIDSHLWQSFLRSCGSLTSTRWRDLAYVLAMATPDVQIGPQWSLSHEGRGQRLTVFDSETMGWNEPVSVVCRAEDVKLYQGLFLSTIVRRWFILGVPPEDSVLPPNHLLLLNCMNQVQLVLKDRRRLNFKARVTASQLLEARVWSQSRGEVLYSNRCSEQLAAWPMIQESLSHPLLVEFALIFYCEVFELRQLFQNGLPLSDMPLTVVGKGLQNRSSVQNEQMSTAGQWYFNLSPTERCQYECQFCNCWRLKSEDRLAKEQWFEVLERIAPVLKGQRLNFAGGEPLLYPDLDQIIAYASKLGIRTSLATNAGTLNRERAHRLASSGIDSIGFSLDGFSETHDRLRGRSEAFSQVLQSIDWIREVNPFVEIFVLAILMSDNLAEIPHLIKLVKDHDGIDSLHFQALSRLEPAEPGWWLRDPLWPNTEEVNSLIDSLIEMQILEREQGIYPLTIANSWQHLRSMQDYFRNPLRQKSKTCTIDQSGFSINPKGEVKLCPFFPPIGSLVSQDFSQIFHQDSSEYRETIRRIRQCGQLACHARTNCTFEDQTAPGFYADGQKPDTRSS